MTDSELVVALRAILQIPNTLNNCDILYVIHELACGVMNPAESET